MTTRGDINKSKNFFEKTNTCHNSQFRRKIHCDFYKLT